MSRARGTRARAASALAALLAAGALAGARPCSAAQAAEPALAEPAAEVGREELERFAAEWRARPGERAALFAAFAARGPAAARAALEGFAGVELFERRLRSALVESAGDFALAPAALALLADPDREVRERGLRFLGEVQPAAAERAAQAEIERERGLALERAALEDPDPDLRRLALLGLGRLGGAPQVASLERASRELAPPERAFAARVLAAVPAARELVVDTVQRAFATGAAADVAADVLAELLREGYGARLAELPSGGERALDRVPFALGSRHADPAVQQASAVALARFVARARVLGAAARADRTLAALAGEGLDPARAWRQRAELALRGETDVAIAEQAARELARLAERAAQDEALAARWEAGVVAALAAIAAGRPGEAHAPLERARGAARAERGLALAPGEDMRRATGARAHLHMAQAELCAALALLAEGRDVLERGVLERARAAHLALLQAQDSEVRRRFELGRAQSFDALFFDDVWALDLALSPSAGGSPLAGEAGLELALRLYTAVAVVAPAEMPGFARPEGAAELEVALTDPERDPERREALGWTRETWLGEDGQRLPAFLADLELAALRTPSRAALRHAESLRAEARPREARELALRMRADLAGRPAPLGIVAAQLDVEIDRSIGASHTDAGEPAEAERALLAALERLVDLESEARANGLDPALWQAQTADVYVSLAVNANVKGAEPERALGYFEKAYELRQDDFMRVLLACYRARAGRADDARAILADAVLAPANYYNMACTYALLGEPERALDYLARDFAENHASPASLERQQTWAAGDPDLASLAGDPRFASLLAREFAR